MAGLELLSVVALLEDIAAKGLLRGQVGTIVETLAPGVYEVEFSDDAGRTYASLALRSDQLMRLPPGARPSRRLTSRDTFRPAIIPPARERGCGLLSGGGLPCTVVSLCGLFLSKTFLTSFDSELHYGSWCCTWHFWS